MRMQTEMELRMFRQNEFMYHKMREAALNNQPMQVMAEPSNEPSSIAKLNLHVAGTQLFPEPSPP